MLKKNFHPNAVFMMIAVSVLILFAFSSLRHALFQSTAWDLGIFDQAVYLISQNQIPISSFMGFHLLGDHAAFIFYPLALLYKIYPDVHWLLAIQAIALAGGALPTYYLALQAGLKQSQAIAMAFVYLLYPFVFNINLFDFHPEVIALPTLLAAVLAARLNQMAWFSAAIVLILSCKAVLSLTVAAMGLWLIFFEKKHWYGVIGLFSGTAWFLIATQLIIPYFGGDVASVSRHIGRYRHLGNSFGEIAQNLLFQPQLIIKAIFNLENFFYIFLLLVPIIWGISLPYLSPLLCAIPALAMNILSNDQAQKDLIHQYSLPILPFLLLVVISTLADGRGWLQNQRAIILWSLVSFLALAKFGYFGSKYLSSIDTWQATQEAVAQIQTKGSVLTTAQIAPHLSQRSIIRLSILGSEYANLAEFEYVLLSVRNPGWASSQVVTTTLVERLKNAPEFQLSAQRDEVYLFHKKP